MASSITCTCVFQIHVYIWNVIHSILFSQFPFLVLFLLIIINSFNVSSCRWLNILCYFSVLRWSGVRTPPPQKKIKIPLGSPLIHRRCTLVERCRETAEACAVHAMSAGVTSLFEVSFIWFNIKHKNGVQIDTCADQDFLNRGRGWEGRLKNHLPGLGMSETFFWYLTYTLPNLLLIRTWNAVLSTSIYLPHLAKPIRNNYFQEIPQK